MKRNIDISVGMQLHNRRTELGLTQSQLADAIGIASQQVQKYEKGANSMNAARLCEFAKFLNVPVAYLFEGVEQAVGGSKARKIGGIEESGVEFEYEENAASDRESIELMKSFRRIKDHILRKRTADLLRTMSTKGL